MSRRFAQMDADKAMGTTSGTTSHEYRHAHTTDRILRAFYDVYNELGYGFLEAIYQATLGTALRELGLHVDREVAIDVLFRGTILGHYKADLLVERGVIVEVKAARTLLPEHEAQLINYLRATGVEIGLLLNFGRAPAFRRLIFTNRIPNK